MAEKQAYIGFGSNLGDRVAHCRACVRLVGETPGCRILGCSDLFRTEPVGVQGQDWYVNGVFCLGTLLSPRELLSAILGVEAKMGRVRHGRWEPRIIDLDLLLYGDEVIREPGLNVPHPLMHERRFVLVPLAQLAPDLVHPALGKSVKVLLQACPLEGQTIVRLEEDET